MAFKIGADILADSDGVRFIRHSTNPSNPVEGQVYYNTSDDKLRQWNGSEWEDVGSDPSFKYNTIITKSFVLGGYKSGTPYRNVNRMVHATDVMTNLGDRIAYAFSYSTGAPSLTKAWIFGANGNHSSANANVIAFNMATESQIAYNSANNLTSARNDAGAAFKETEYCYVTSGTNSDKFNFTTETCSASLSGIIADGTGGGVQAANDDIHALLYGDNSSQAIQFATDTSAERVVASTCQVGCHNQQKPINTKWYKAYGGHEGTYNGGYNYRRIDMITNVHDATGARPMSNYGEENFDMGQDWNYCHGHYDGAQNNRGQKFFYATDAGYELGSGSLRTGIPGGSSGVCGWYGG